MVGRVDRRLQGSDRAPARRRRSGIYRIPYARHRGCDSKFATTGESGSRRPRAETCGTVRTELAHGIGARSASRRCAEHPPTRPQRDAAVVPVVPPLIPRCYAQRPTAAPSAHRHPPPDLDCAMLVRRPPPGRPQSPTALRTCAHESGRTAGFSHGWGRSAIDLRRSSIRSPVPTCSPLDDKYSWSWAQETGTPIVGVTRTLAAAQSDSSSPRARSTGTPLNTYWGSMLLCDSAAIFAATEITNPRG